MYLQYPDTRAENLEISRSTSILTPQEGEHARKKLA